MVSMKPDQGRVWGAEYKKKEAGGEGEESEFLSVYQCPGRKSLGLVDKTVHSHESSPVEEMDILLEHAIVNSP